MTIEATFRNGVFVPVTPPRLPDNERVRLVVEPIEPDAPEGPPPQPPAPLPRHRIKLDPQLSREIAESPEFDPNEA